MRKVFQKYENDCFRACIASLLECPIEQIPNFMKDGPDHFPKSWREWEKDKPFRLLDVDLSEDALELMSDMTMIATGKSPRGDYDHALIMKGKKIIHDPYPVCGIKNPKKGCGIEGKVKYYTLFIPKNPSKPFCPICLEEMVMSRIECVDLSGYMFGWLCGCDDKLRGKINIEEKT